jgi:hypothetical protein
MRKTIILVLLGLSSGGMILAQNKTFDFMGWQPAAATNGVSDYVTLPKPTPTICILPEEIEQGSIQIDQFTTYPDNSNADNLVVRFVYTEAAAKKMLAFRREHAGHEVVTLIGSIERRGTIAPLGLKPAGWTEEGWLKRRTEKFFCLSEDAAKKIVEGLTKK